MDLSDVMRTTFAARDYTDDPLPDSLLYELIEVARFAPSGGNRQGNRVIVVPELGIVAVITKVDFGQRVAHEQSDRLFEDHILPLAMAGQ